MKRLLLLFVAFLLFHLTALAQEGWFWQNPKPQGNNLHDIYLFEDGASIAVGDAGTILKIDSNGQIESVKNNICDYRESFGTVFFNSQQSGWVGGMGTIFKYEDGGNSWQKVNLDTTIASYSVNKIYFLDENIGWFSCGFFGWGFLHGKLYKTSDGGSIWNCINDGSYWTDYQFLDADTGYGIMGYDNDSLYKTVNSGITWEAVPQITPGLQKLFFLDGLNGWIGATSSIWKTTDGITWQLILSGIDCKDIYFNDSQAGWAIINQDSIIYTADGGNNWNGQSCGNSNPVMLNTFRFNNQGYGITVGSFGHIRNKESNSNEWQAITESFLYGKITDIHLLDKTNIWLCGGEYTGYYGPNYSSYENFNNVLLHTNDGGENWEKTKFQDTTTYGFTDVFFLNSQYGWVIGINDYMRPNIIMHSSDGGNSWQSQYSGISWIILDKIYFVDSLYGWILGNEWSSQGILLSTVDGGDTWQYSQNNFPYNFTPSDIHFINRNTGWMVGSDEGGSSYGEVYYTEDGGKNWQKIRSTPNPHSFYLYVHFFDSLKGYVVYKEHYNNSLSTFECTTDGGNTWQPFLIAENVLIKDVFFTDEQLGWAVGQNSDSYYSEIYRTNDGGLNWTRCMLVPTEYYNKVAFADSNTGWLIGSSVILKTTNGGVSFVEEEEIDEMPTDYNLSRNYPNPFNPSTKIRYSIPQASNVVIKIFDILGNEIETLVDEEKPAGTYEVEFNSNLINRVHSSGIYFYQLQAGSFVETKKMILLK
jgi:photosystem II stability/assembly factor-like uncharacterized protein